jgi:hypothetical protein
VTTASQGSNNQIDCSDCFFEDHIPLTCLVPFDLFSPLTASSFFDEFKIRLELHRKYIYKVNKTNRSETSVLYSESKNVNFNPTRSEPVLAKFNVPIQVNTTSLVEALR